MATRTPSGKASSGRTTSRSTSGRTTTGSKTQSRTSTTGASAKSTAKAATKPAPKRSGKASSTSADSPILPVEQLDALRKIKPGAVDWIIEQTQAEAEHRRAEQVRVNNLIFVEHLFAQAAALIVGVAGIGGGVWLVTQGQTWPGVAIAAVVMVALTVVQVSAKKSRK